MTTLYVPTGFSYVAASLLSLTTVLTWQGFAVAGARKRARVPYPQAYADKAEQESSKDAMVFNCMQRAHQNTLENVPIIVISTLITGLRCPIVAAAGCGIWTVLRIMYTLRYGTGEPKKRALPIQLGFLLQIGLSIFSGKVVLDLIKAGV